VCIPCPGKASPQLPFRFRGGSRCRICSRTSIERVSDSGFEFHIIPHPPFRNKTLRDATMVGFNRKSVSPLENGLNISLDLPLIFSSPVAGLQT